MSTFECGYAIDPRGEGLAVPSLLHIDASIRQGESTSRKLSAYFADQWRQNHAGAGYVYRDLGVEPIPHITHGIREWLFDPETDVEGNAEKHGVSPEDRALTQALTAEVREATTLLIAIPMYNYTVPSSFKAWIDRIVTPAHMIAPGTEVGLLRAKSVVVVTARGGSYAPGTPREGWDFQEPYVRAVLSAIGLADDLHFAHSELTFAQIVPQMAALKPIAEKSLSTAYESLGKLAVQ
ncbi:FMN-dependent NADH-azoreductase [Frankia sp. AgKG'84/4]|uniref:FMN-dependent NADH-azoreductase n=1 Tax=Frankia sp. AgKG'84/4 TaxID=573490 RepID=UPI00200C30FF|nr:NAD(P)H-dependent oxidoreductase [Frankia sp. AgKG'84/4]MCL9794491.1 NAD(P)H-dependent oxidoreductase [Frankia sp. AgKG'84/4]